MTRISKPTRICVILSAAVLLLLALVCLIGVLKFDNLFQMLIGKKIAILPDTEVFENWKSPSVPVYFSIYLYNLTNPKDVLNGSRPHFTEVGPFVYLEDRQRVNITFSDESPPKTVRFKHRIFYYFVPELSVGPDDQGLITSLDLPTATLSINDLSFGMQLALSFLNFAPFVTRTPKEIIWGFVHNVLQICHQFGACDTNRAGLMSQNNGTKVVEYVIDTGAYDPFNVGRIIEYNGKKKLDYWNADHANMINGTDGSVTPMNLKLGSRIHFFVPDFCRSFYSDAVAKAVASNNKEIELLRFASPPEQAMNATIYPPNKAFCPTKKVGPKCPPTGMIPLSPCSGDGRLSVPVFASQPHFFGADPSIPEAFDGLRKPDPKNDSTSILIEPNTGFVLEAYKRVQINMYVENTGSLNDVYKKMAGPYFFPLAWFSEIAVADKKSLDRINNLVLKPKRLLPILLCAIGAFAAVLAILVIAVLITCSRLQQHTNSNRHIINVQKNSLKQKENIFEDKSNVIQFNQWSTKPSPDTEINQIVESNPLLSYPTEKPNC